MKNVYLCFLLPVIFWSCNDNKLPEFTKIDKLRIIALEVNNPEVNPGDTVTVTPWVSDINETAALTDTVTVCVDPGLAYGANPSCDASPTKLDL